MLEGAAGQDRVKCIAAEDWLMDKRTRLGGWRQDREGLAAHSTWWVGGEPPQGGGRAFLGALASMRKGT